MVFGKVSFILLRELKKEMLIHAVLMESRLTVSDILNPSLSIADILKNIREVEVFEFVHKILSHGHILFLYENKNFKIKCCPNSSL
jgi:hypothetical protein